MKDKLLYRWQRKYDELQMNIKENERRLKYAKERQGRLKYDVLTQLLIAIICAIIIKFLFYMEPYIIFYFYVLYHYFIRLLRIVAIVYNGIQIIKTVKRFIQHTRPVHNWKKPIPKVSAIDRGIEPEHSCQVEIEKISWILEQYRQQRWRMEEIRYKIEKDDLMTEELLEKALEEVIIYETVRSAKI